MEERSKADTGTFAETVLKDAQKSTVQQDAIEAAQQYPELLMPLEDKEELDYLEYEAGEHDQYQEAIQGSEGASQRFFLRDAEEGDDAAMVPREEEDGSDADFQARAGTERAELSSDAQEYGTEDEEIDARYSRSEELGPDDDNGGSSKQHASGQSSRASSESEEQEDSPRSIFKAAPREPRRSTLNDDVLDQFADLGSKFARRDPLSEAAEVITLREPEEAQMKPTNAHPLDSGSDASDMDSSETVRAKVKIGSESASDSDREPDTDATPESASGSEQEQEDVRVTSPWSATETTKMETQMKTTASRHVGNKAFPEIYGAPTGGLGAGGAAYFDEEVARREEEEDEELERQNREIEEREREEQGSEPEAGEGWAGETRGSPQKLDLRSLLAAPDSDDEFKHLLPPPIDLSDVNTQGGGARDDARAAGGERRVQEKEERKQEKVEISYDASAAVPRIVDAEDLRAEAGLDAMEAALHFMDKDPAAVAASMAHTQSELAARAAERAAKSGVSQAGLDALRKEREWFAAQNTSVNSVEHWLKENPDRANDFIKRSGLSLDQYEESSDDLPGRGTPMNEGARERRDFEAVSAMYHANERGRVVGDGESEDGDGGGWRTVGRGGDFDSSQDERGFSKNKLFQDMSEPELRRYVRDTYPWREGESYSFPAPIAIMEYQEEKRREWHQTREYKMLGAPAKTVVPAFMSGLNITEEMLEQAERTFLHSNGTFNLERLRQAISNDIETVGNLVFDDAPQDPPLTVDPLEVYRYLQEALGEVEAAMEDEDEDNLRQQQQQSKITTGPFYENGYDVNQYRRPFDVEEGAFADGKRFDWVPQIQQQFWKCVRHGKTTIPMLQTYLDQGALVNGFCPVWNYATALHWAAWRGHADTCAHLIQLGANVSAHASCGSSALHCAAFWGHLKVIKLLVQHGADLWDRRHEDGRAPIDVAESASSRLMDRTRAIVWMRREMGLENVSYTAHIPKKHYDGDPENLLDPEVMEYFTIPAGKYVPFWEREEAKEEDSSENATAVPYEDVHEMFKDQRAQESAQLQMEATAEHIREEGARTATTREPAKNNSSEAKGPERDEDADDSLGLLDWDDSSESFKGMQGGTGQEYGRKSMQSKELRKLGVSRPGKF